MERLTKKDGANRNIIEVKRYSDEDWIIVENTKYKTISFHSKAIDKLAEFEDFMEEQGIESLEELIERYDELQKEHEFYFNEYTQSNIRIKKIMAERDNAVACANMFKDAFALSKEGTFKEIQQENQALKSRWEKLRKFIKERLETSKGAEWYAVEEIDCEMQELEKEMGNEHR